MKRKHEQDIARLLVEIGAVNESLGNHEAAEKAYKRCWYIGNRSAIRYGNQIYLITLFCSMPKVENSFANLESAAIRACQRNLQMKVRGSIGDLYKDPDAAAEANDAYRQALEVALRTDPICRIPAHNFGQVVAITETIQRC